MEKGKYLGRLLQGAGFGGAPTHFEKKSVFERIQPETVVSIVTISGKLIIGNINFI